MLLFKKLLVQDPGVDDAAPEHAEQAGQIELGRRLHGCPTASIVQHNVPIPGDGDERGGDGETPGDVAHARGRAV